MDHRRVLPEMNITSIKDSFKICDQCRSDQVEAIWVLETKSVIGKCGKCGNEQDAHHTDKYYRFCPKCGCEEYVARSNAAYVQRYCKQCNWARPVAPNTGMDYEEEYYLPDGGPPETLRVGRPRWVPAGTKKLEFE